MTKIYHCSNKNLCGWTFRDKVFKPTLLYKAESTRNKNYIYSHSKNKNKLFSFDKNSFFCLER